MSAPRMYSVEEAVKAQRSLRDAAGLPPQQFPVQAFVGMISDEVESLRTRGRTDEEIVAMIRSSSSIEISVAELVENYASPEERGHHGE